MNDVQNEYSPDKSLQLRVYSISQKLSVNHSMYQLSSEDLDIVCMCLNDSLVILDEIKSELDTEEKRESLQYSEELEEILAFLGGLWRGDSIQRYTGGYLVGLLATSFLDPPQKFSEIHYEKNSPKNFLW